MNLDSLLNLIDKELANKTLGTLREEAARELNGTCFTALRLGDGRRCVLLACVTGEHELSKLRGLLVVEEAHPFGEWASTSLLTAVANTTAAGGYCFGVERKSDERLSSVVFIAAEPCSIAKLERLFNLQP